MSIALTAAQEEHIQEQISSSGDLTTRIELIDEGIESLTSDKAESLNDYTIFKKFYDYFTEITNYSEIEKKYTNGEYASDPVTDSDIDDAAQGEGVLFPTGDPIFWDKLYPRRVNSLYGTDTSGFGNGFPLPTDIGPYENIQIDKELANYGIGAPFHTARKAAQQAQYDALNDYTIPALNDLITALQEEQSRYTFMSSLITQAQSSLAKSIVARTKVKVELDNNSPYPTEDHNRAIYLASRKIDIANRSTQITSSFLQVYDKRYLFINLMVNRAFGQYSSYLSYDDSITIMRQEKSTIEDQIEEYETYLG